jgi:nucleotide-binding universal stress UspA family protein
MSKELLNRILVPLDGSTHAEAILSQLRRILPPHESEVILVQATSHAPWASDDDIEKYMRRAAFLLTNDGYPTNFLIRRGSPAEAILETAANVGASLIALTTHGRTGAARWVLGSVAERVLQASRLPVLVARSFPTDVCRGLLESRPIRNFLVPLDGSRQSLGALAPVLNLARPVDAHVTLLHVSEPSPYDGRWETPDETLQEADRRLREACIPARVEHRKGEPAEVILSTAEKEQIDLIAMTTHGRSGPSRWIFGSVAARVLRAASIPLLVVRHAVPAEIGPENVAHSAKIPPSPGSAEDAGARGTGLAHLRP